MSVSRRNQSSQWPAQFLAAGELGRHKYVVSFTMGNNTPVADLMVGHPKTGSQFWADVKGVWSGGWFANKKPQRQNLFYILVRVGAKRADDRFFILTQAEYDAEIDAYCASHSTSGINWSDKYENQWAKLPDWNVPA